MLPLNPLLRSRNASSAYLKLAPAATNKAASEETGWSLIRDGGGLNKRVDGAAEDFTLKVRTAAVGHSRAGIQQGVRWLTCITRPLCPCRAGGARVGGARR